MSDRWIQGRAYVEKMRQSGQTDEQIFPRLRDAGWQAIQVERLLNLTLSANSAKPSDYSEAPSAPLLGLDEGVRSTDGDLLLRCTLPSTLETSTPGNIVMVLREKDEQWRRQFHEVMQARVANSGHAVVIDELAGQSPKGKLYVLLPDGNTAFEHRFEANIEASGIAEDGSFAWCTTLQNPDREAHSRKLFLFSLPPASWQFSVDCPPFKVKLIRRAEEEVAVHTEYDVRYRYSIGGELQDPDNTAKREEAAQLARAVAEKKGYDLLDWVEALLDRSEPSEMSSGGRKEAMQVLGIAATCRVSDNTHAKIRRRLGELALADGDQRSAVQHFREALEFNPNVGVKRLVESIERELDNCN